MEIGETREVLFNPYCDSCRYRELEEKDDPCFDCLDEPVNVHSHKPVHWEPREKN